MELPTIDPIILRALTYAAFVLTAVTFLLTQRSRRDEARDLLRQRGVRGSLVALRGTLRDLERVDPDGQPVNELGRTRRMLVQAGWGRIHAAEWIAARVLLGLVIGALIGFVQQSFALGIVAAVLAYGAPASYLSGRAEGQTRRLGTQLRKAAWRMAAVREAGNTVQTALEMIAVRFPAPLGPEFRQVVGEVRNGSSVSTALRAAERRIPGEEFRLFSLACRVNAEHGGHGFGDMMKNLAERLQKEEELRGLARASFQQMKVSYYFVLMLIVGLALFISGQDPDALAPLIRSEAGQIVLLVLVGWAYFGHRIIQSRSKLEAAK